MDLKEKIKSYFSGENKRILPYFWLFLALNLVVFNWASISFIFNYHFLGETLTASLSKLNPENYLPFLKENPFTIQPTSASGEQDNFLDGEYFLSIPKISIKTPLVFTTSADDEAFRAGLKKGVLHYPQTALPGENGVCVILGHSAPDGWPKIDYDWVFNDLNKLEPGDIFYVNSDTEELVYKVSRKFFLKKGSKLPEDLTNDKSVVVLISCWPPGKASKRIVVEAILENKTL